MHYALRFTNEATFYRKMQYTVFGVSGGEAVDTAIKIARKAIPGRRRILSTFGGYHGHTGLALAAGDAKYREPFFSSSADFVQIPFDDIPALEQTVSNRSRLLFSKPYWRPWVYPFRAMTTFYKQKNNAKSTAHY